MGPLSQDPPESVPGPAVNNQNNPLWVALNEDLLEELRFRLPGMDAHLHTMNAQLQRARDVAGGLLRESRAETAWSGGGGPGPVFFFVTLELLSSLRARYIPVVGPSLRGAASELVSSFFS